MTPSTTLINPKNPAHAFDYPFECGLLWAQFTSHLDLYGGEYGDALAHHVLRDFNLSPSAEVGPAFGGGVKGPGGFNQDGLRRAADNLTRPPHAGVDAKQSLVGRQVGKDFSDAFGFSHG